MPNKQPKLFTKKTYAITFTAVLIGASLGIYREYRDMGSVTNITIGSSAIAFVIGIVIIVLVGRHANKPEK